MFRYVGVTLANVLTICFPLYVWQVGLSNKYWTGGYFCAIAILRMLALTKDKNHKNLALVAIPATLAMLTLMVGASSGLYYPVAVNALLFVIFASTLFFPPTIIERFISMRGKKIDEVVVIYAFRLTIVWCCLYILNGVVATILAINQLIDLWLIYNGIIAYTLVGALLVGEFLLRPRLKARMTLHTKRVVR